MSSGSYSIQVQIQGAVEAGQAFQSMAQQVQAANSQIQNALGVINNFGTTIQSLGGRVRSASAPLQQLGATEQQLSSSSQQLASAVSPFTNQFTNLTSSTQRVGANIPTNNNINFTTTTVNDSNGRITECFSKYLRLT
jgi:methyl-accepting chemotaxis protein